MGPNRVDAWPEGWERTPPERRSPASPGIPKNVAEQQIRRLLQSMGGRDVRIQYAAVWRDTAGLVRQPKDTAVVVRFRDHSNDNYVLGSDGYMTTRDNLAALALMLEDLASAVARGLGVTVSKLFNGVREEEVPRVEQQPWGNGYEDVQHKRPPSPGEADGAAWWHLFGFSSPLEADLETCEGKYRDMVKKVHPDRPDGDEEAMRIWAEAISQAREALRSGKS